MQILPPQLQLDNSRYYSDLAYRFEVDQELLAERAPRFQLMFADDVTRDHLLSIGVS